MVVSEMNERLSPKNAPPSTVATNSGTSPSAPYAISTTSGTRATTVPTDVPIDIDMKHAPAKIAGSSSDGGKNRSVTPTVASIAPILLASAAKAPAMMNIHTM